MEQGLPVWGDDTKKGKLRRLLVWSRLALVPDNPDTATQQLIKHQKLKESWAEMAITVNNPIQGTTHARGSTKALVLTTLHIHWT